MACAVELSKECALQQHSDTSSLRESDVGCLPAKTKDWELYDEDAVGDKDALLRDRTAFTTAVKFLKVVVYAVTFCIVLGGGVASKATLILMTSVAGKGKSLTPCNITGLDGDTRFLIKLSDEERYSWTWCLLFIQIVPEVLTFFRSARLCVFKQYSKPKISSFLVVTAAESLHVFGLALMLLVAFPQLHALTALSLTNAACLVPSFFNLISSWSSSSSTRSILNNVLNLAALMGQLSIFAWAATKSDSETWGLASAVLASFGWWENFAGRLSCLSDLKRDIEESRNFIYVFVSLWKIVLVFVVCMGCVFVDGDEVGMFLKSLASNFDGIRHNVTVVWPISNEEQIPNELRPPEERILQVLRSSPFLPVLIASIHIAASYICYSFGKFACKVCIQGFSYALPIMLTVPTTMALLVTVCSKRDAFAEVLPYHFWSCPEDALAYFVDEFGFLWIAWLVSQMVVTAHVWFPHCERMASTHKLFVNPMYCTVLIDQSLALNRRKDEKAQLDPDKKPSLAQMADVDSQVYPMIFACATMWHETPDEMEQLLKSIMRMDFHQCQQAIIQEGLQVRNPDYYEMEAHIFFDDAFVISDEDDDKMTINSFVKDLVVSVNAAARKVYRKFGDLSPPIKVATPYGGRLIWTLHGKNMLIVHLKNKDLIRHKKRWSQVMYMYYLLGYNLKNCFAGATGAVEEVLYRNTFILALDGDIDFKPDAVQLLVDLMNRNRGLGAACGRIHPVGSGLMVYYQKFEYAIGHWLQKATEHMIGCVLCSPGCFSLFRAEALVRNNTVLRYATTSREAIEYVQFDQGEDRWLCTLLLQRGYRVEYSAASDAYTHCPESFAEFYTQRRRWAPSTLANIADLLVHYKDTVECNDNISRPYVAYQVLLMMGTILGPGTIFLMLVGAMVSAFGVSNWQSFATNIVPIVFFIVICFHAKNDTQIFVAQVLSALYALLMMAVLVSISLQLVVEGITSPSAIFVLAMAASFLTAALAHPREFWCVAHGLLYFLAVPSMYLLLALYSFVNLHVVSWGTREVAVKKTKRQMQKEMMAAVKTPTASTKGSGMFDWINMLADKRAAEEEGGLSFNLANLFRCMCCTYPKPDPASLHMARVEGHLKEITTQMQSMQRQMDNTSNRVSGFRRRSTPHALQKDFPLNAVAEDEDAEDEILNDPINDEEDDAEEIPEMDHHKHWLKEKCLESCERKNLPQTERVFWNELIEEYLTPLADNPEEKAKVSRQLLDLRNNVVFGILMLNSLFVLVVFLLQMQKDTLHVEWPLDGKANITYLPEFTEIRIEMIYLQLEPINLVLVFFFTLILVIQFVGMILHRLQTLSHILSSTELLESKSKDEEDKIDFSQLTDKLERQGLMDADDEEDDENDQCSPGGLMGPAPIPQEGRRPSILKSCQDGGSHMGDRGRPRSLSLAIEKDLLKILQKDRKFELKVRRMSRIPNPLEALQRRTSSYNLGIPSRVQTPRCGSMRGSMREGIDRLNRAFGSGQGTPGGSVRHSYINRAFQKDSDTISCNSIQMTNLRTGSAADHSADRSCVGDDAEFESSTMLRASSLRKKLDDIRRDGLRIDQRRPPV